MTITIENEASEELLTAMNKLIPQLSSSTPQMDAQTLKAYLEQPGVYLFVARSDAEPDHGAIVGMSTLATFRLPTGLRAWVEDVVVDGAARGQGIGQRLVDAMVAYGQEIHAKSIDLTSRPSREAANRLYQRSGFVLRETNVYRYHG